MIDTGISSVATQPLRLVYSYAEEDEVHRASLERHLSLLRRSGVIADWHFRKIVAGRSWEGEIDEHFGNADIYLLLLSADFLASDYCYQTEMNVALQRRSAGEAVVIPIIVRATDWTSAPLSSLQALPTSAKPVTSWNNLDEAWTDVAKGIRAAVADLQLRRSAPADQIAPAEDRSVISEEDRRAVVTLRPIVNQLWQFSAASYGDSIPAMVKSSLVGTEGFSNEGWNLFFDYLSSYILRELAGLERSLEEAELGSRSLSVTAIIERFRQMFDEFVLLHRTFAQRFVPQCPAVPDEVVRLWNEQYLTKYNWVIHDLRTVRAKLPSGLRQRFVPDSLLQPGEQIHASTLEPSIDEIRRTALQDRRSGPPES